MNSDFSHRSSGRQAELDREEKRNEEMIAGILRAIARYHEGVQSSGHTLQQIRNYTD